MRNHLKNCIINKKFELFPTIMNPYQILLNEPNIYQIEHNNQLICDCRLPYESGCKIGCHQCYSCITKRVLAWKWLDFHD